MVLGIALLAVSALCLLFGLMRLLQGQPMATWHPYLLFGGICTLIMGIILPMVHIRYGQAEMRRIEAMDLSDSE